MSTWTHPALGPIELIPPEHGPKKVWKHFYDVAEHWERICEQDVAAMRSAGEAVVGVRREDYYALPWMDAERWREGRALLLGHHDTAYAPTYLSEMASPETQWTEGMDRQHRHKALTPRSIFVVVQLDQPSWVVTAYRPHPLTTNVEWGERDLRRYAEEHFLKRTSMDIESLVQAAADNLERASSSVPTSVGEVWWLASAVGYGRMLSQHERVSVTLPAAESTLEATGEELRLELQNALDWGGSLDRIAAALKEDRPESLEDVLIASEEMLVVATALGIETRIEEFLAEAEVLLSWSPPEWTSVGDMATQRGRSFGDSCAQALRLWEAIENAAIGAVLRRSEPAFRPEASLVDVLLPNPGLLERLTAMPAYLTGYASEWLRTTLDNITVTAPAPAMGGEHTGVKDRVVKGGPAPNAPHFRVFIVDEENRAGYEITGEFKEPDSELWCIDQTDVQALIVIIGAPHPLPGLALESLLSHAESREDTFVAVEHLIPPR